MTHTCKECSKMFLSWKEYDNHVKRHLQTHLDKWAPKTEKKNPWSSLSNIPEGMNRDLLKVFVNYNLGPDKSMLCLWRNGSLSCALREQAREQELQSRLNEWLQE
jgi:hypothetical protein